MNGSIPNQEEVRKALREACFAEGTQKAFAKKHDISEVVISDMIRGRRDVSARIAEIVGYKRITMFVKFPVKDIKPKKWCVCRVGVEQALCIHRNDCQPMAEAYGSSVV